MIEHASSLWVQQLFWFFLLKNSAVFAHTKLESWNSKILLRRFIFVFNVSLKRSSEKKWLVENFFDHKLFYHFLLLRWRFLQIRVIFSLFKLCFFHHDIWARKIRKIYVDIECIQCSKLKKKTFFRQKLHRAIEKTRRVFEINEVLNEFLDRNLFRVFWSSNILKRNCKKRLCKKRRIVFNTFWKTKFKVVIYDWTQLQFWKTFFNLLKVDIIHFSQLFISWSKINDIIIK